MKLVIESENEEIIITMTAPLAAWLTNPAMSPALVEALLRTGLTVPIEGSSTPPSPPVVTPPSPPVVTPIGGQIGINVGGSNYWDVDWIFANLRYSAFLDVENRKWVLNRGEGGNLNVWLNGQLIDTLPNLPAQLEHEDRVEWQIPPQYPVQTQFDFRYLSSTSAASSQAVSLMTQIDVVRFMDTWKINGSPVTQPSELPVPIPTLESWCRETNTQGWYCIPHRMQIGDDPFSAPVIIEHSNEIWNNGGPFEQTRDLRADWVRRHPGTEQWMANHYASAVRMGQIARAWGPRHTYVHGSQVGGEWHLNEMLKWTHPEMPVPLSEIVNAVAINAYIGHSIDLTVLTVDQILDQLDAEIPRFQEQVGLIRNTMPHTMQLWAYEGGSHLTGPNLPAVIEKNRQVNEHPRMADIMSRLIAAFRAEGGSLFVGYKLTERPHPHGYWGFRRNMFESAPRWEALIRNK